MTALISKLIIETTKIHEDSWIQSSDHTLCGYSISLEVAAKQACEKLGVEQELAKLVELSLTGTWDDALYWATEYDNYDSEKADEIIANEEFESAEKILDELDL